MSMREFEAANVIFPLKNADVMTSQACLAVSSGAQSYYLPSLFMGEKQGSPTGMAWEDNGHYYTLCADMPANKTGSVYVALSCSQSDGTSIDPTATGIGKDICWPIPHGTFQSYVIPPGRHVRTGLSTATTYRWIHYRGSATGYLRIYRSSLGHTQDTSQFRQP